MPENTENREKDHAFTEAETDLLPASGSVLQRKATASPLFFQGVEIKRLLTLGLCIGGFAAVVHILSELNMKKAGNPAVSDFLLQYALFASCSLLGLVLSERNGMECLLWRKKVNVRRKLASLILFGIVPGLTIGFVYHLMFAPYRFSPRVPLWIRLIRDVYDTFIYSLRAAVTEELVFRLLLFSGFVYVLKRVFDPLVEKGYSLVRWIPLLFSLVFSALLFGIAHGVYGFTNAFLAGLALGICFLRGGIESAILCHFVADFVFYNLTYLQDFWKASLW